MRKLESIKNTIKAGMGKMNCDLLIKNIKLVNVYSSEVYESNIYIKDDRIVNIDPNIKLNSNKTVDGKGKYAIPGLIDSHIHFEPTLLSPEALAELIVPAGTTTVCADIMEIANVAGIKGINAMIKSIDKLPYQSLIEVSSRVPTAPGLETTGGVLGVEDVKKILDKEFSISLGEIDTAKVVNLKEEYLKKIEYALNKRKIVNGHTIGASNKELNAYVSSGITDDHETVEFEELIQRLRLGMTIMIREGSTERNAEKLLKGIIKNNINCENIIFCTDDKHANEIKKEGHINFIINKAISLGMEPITAIKMATINAARHFRIEDEIGSITPGRLANILLIDDINDITPEDVFYKGRHVVKNGEFIFKVKKGDYPEWIKNTIKINNNLEKNKFEINTVTNKDKTKVNVISIHKDQIINDWDTFELTVKNKKVQEDLKKDILRLSVIERYGKNGNIGNAFVKGFGLKEGCLASSLSHDHHNIVCVSTNIDDMILAIEMIKEKQGGLVATSSGEVLGMLELPIGGLMSQESADIVIKQIEELNEIARQMGCSLPAPFMTLSFISLPTVPDLGLTDKGLIDVKNFKIIDTVID